MEVKSCIFEVCLIGNSCLFDGLGHLVNVGRCGANNRFPLIREVRRKDDAQNVLYNACVGMRGDTKIEFGLELQGKC